MRPRRVELLTLRGEALRQLQRRRPRALARRNRPVADDDSPCSVHRATTAHVVGGLEPARERRAAMAGRLVECERVGARFVDGHPDRCRVPRHRIDRREEVGIADEVHRQPLLHVELTVSVVIQDLEHDRPRFVRGRRKTEALRKRECELALRQREEAFGRRPVPNALWRNVGFDIEVQVTHELLAERLAVGVEDLNLCALPPPELACAAGVERGGRCAVDTHRVRRVRPLHGAIATGDLERRRRHRHRRHEAVPRARCSDRCFRGRERAPRDLLGCGARRNPELSARRHRRELSLSLLACRRRRARRNEGAHIRARRRRGTFKPMNGEGRAASDGDEDRRQCDGPSTLLHSRSTMVAYLSV